MLPEVIDNRFARRRLSVAARWSIVGGVALVLFIVANVAKGIYTDLLWFSSLGYSAVYTVELTTRLWLFFAGAAVAFAVIAGNVALARRLSPRFGDRVLSEFDLRDLRRAIGVLLYLGAVILAVLFGLVAAAQWDAVLRFFNAVGFGTTDPIFGLDAAFYVFTLPVYRFLQMWLMGALWLTLIATLVVYAVDLSLVSSDIIITPAIKGHVSALGAAIMLLFAAGYRLDVYDLVYSSRGVVSGASYTDVHADLPALWALVAVAVVAAALLLANVFQRGIKLPSVGLGLWAVAIVLANVYPSLVQNFQVKPNEFALEQQYIDYNISSTRQAFGLDKVEVVSIPVQPTLTEAQVNSNADTIANIRLWDYRPLLDTYNQLQSIRLYYDFQDVDVDRYTIDGQYRQVMLSARELSPGKLPAQAQTWVNQRLQYTHGYGVVVSPVNEISPEGLPTLLVQDVPPTGRIGIDRPEIYYGEETTGYVIVNTAAGEFDYPKGNDNVYTNYQGKGDVVLDSPFRKLLYAWEMADLNILISGSVTSQSRIMYHRQIQERVRQVAPFLTLDRDPYIVIADGKLYWIQDAYTSTDKYPYSQPYQGGVNYVRNSVKAVISAYDGTVTFYVFDPADPLIQTYQRIFPVLFTPMAQMPESLRTHVRYPQDLFTIQTDMYRTYHMTDAKVFYNKEDLWVSALETSGQGQQPMEPYYVIMRLAGGSKDEFLLLLPFTPSQKDNMISWLAGRSDGADYGKLLVYNFPKDRLIYGPIQVEARVNQDTNISQSLTLWSQQGSQVIRGNLLVIPIEDSIMYVQPLFIQSETAKLPELKRVIVAIGTKIAMEPSLQLGLDVIFGRRTPTTDVPGVVIAAPAPAASTPRATPTATPPVPTLVPGAPASVADLAASAQLHYQRAQDALKRGDWATYGNEMSQVEAALMALVKATSQ